VDRQTGKTAVVIDANKSTQKEFYDRGNLYSVNLVAIGQNGSTVAKSVVACIEEGGALLIQLL